MGIPIENPPVAGTQVRNADAYLPGVIIVQESEAKSRHCPPNLGTPFTGHNAGWLLITHRFGLRFGGRCPPFVG